MDKLRSQEISFLYLLRLNLDLQKLKLLNYMESQQISRLGVLNLINILNLCYVFLLSFNLKRLPLKTQSSLSKDCISLINLKLRRALLYRPKAPRIWAKKEGSKWKQIKKNHSSITWGAKGNSNGPTLHHLK